MFQHGVAAISFACIVGASACGVCPPIAGSLASVTTQDGAYQGFELRSDCVVYNGEERWILTGTGTHWIDDLSPSAPWAPEREPALSHLAALIGEATDRYATPFHNECGLIDGVIVHPNDWTEIDHMIARAGSALQTADLRETVIVVQPSLGCE